MKQYTKPRITTEEEFDKTQIQEWLTNSHYWVEKNQTYYCKWCHRPTTTVLEGDAVLCKENPKIKELMKNKQEYRVSIEQDKDGLKIVPSWEEPKQECKHERIESNMMPEQCADCGKLTQPQEDCMEIPWNKIEKTNTCWNWTGYLTQKGYGKLNVKSKQHKGGYRHQSAHRLVYELLVGKIPEGLQIDHLCKNTRCVNPEHLEPVTQKENIRRSDNFAGINFRKTKCIKGHPFSGNNLAISLLKKTEGKRICRACNRERWSKSYYKI